MFADPTVIKIYPISKIRSSETVAHHLSPQVDHSSDLEQQISSPTPSQFPISIALPLHHHSQLGDIGSNVIAPCAFPRTFEAFFHRFIFSLYNINGFRMKLVIT